MIKLPAYFTSFGSKADGSARLAFSTQEISDQDFAELKRNLNLFGWLVFQENSVPEVPKEEILADEDKTPSKRLRACLYRLWEKKGKEGQFQAFYEAKMGMLIDYIKDKLD